MRRSSKTIGQRLEDRRGEFGSWLENGIMDPISRASGRERAGYVLSILSNALLLGTLSVSLVFCLVTAMGLPLARRGGTVALIMLSALVLMVPYYLPIKRRTLSRINTIWVLAAIVIFRKKIYASFCSAFAISTGAFGRTFGFDPIILSEGGEEVLCDQFVTALGILLALSWAGACAEGRVNGLDVTLLTLTVTPCLILKEHIPSPWAIVMLAVSICCVLLSGSAKWSSRTEGSRILLRVLLPALLICLLPYWLEPPESYQPRLDYDRLASMFTEYYKDLTSRYSPPDQKTEMEDLSKAGARRLQNRPVMQLYTDRSGIVYLKGSVMAHYNNGQWTPLDEKSLAEQSYAVHAFTDGFTGGGNIDIDLSSDQFGYSGDQSWSMTVSGGDIYVVTSGGGVESLIASFYPYYTSMLIGGDSSRAYIRTYEPGNVLYYPYFPDKSVKELGCDGIACETYIPNPDGLTEYECGYKTPEGTALELAPDVIHPSMEQYFGENGSYTGFAVKTYTEVPPEIRDRLLRIAEENGFLDLPEDECPAAVINYVRELGTYDLNTPAVKNGEDFALWFLENSRSGYCVHFATAAALLLRVCGIPSRYVSGYMTYAYANRWNEITSDEAHAWVEVYRANIGWVPLEATASSGMTTAQTEASGVPSGTDGTTTAETTAETTSGTSATDAGPSEVSQGDLQTGSDENVSGTDGEGGEEDGGGSAEPDGDGRAPRLWLLVLIIPAAAGAVWLRRYLEMSRRLSLYRADSNNCALQIWTECEALLAKTGGKASESAVETAQKAAFSHHTVSRAEIESLERYRAQLIERRKKSAPAAAVFIDRYFRLLY